ncbi:MAG: ribonuclease H family protein [Prevotellaceae bacterium]|jgi:ribonuclease HI|nr:ribonuclease H family protein [Prevotellaceae bacterium]
MPKIKIKFYTVWKGRATGVFDTWESCRKQVHKFEGARYKSFPTRQAALEALETECYSYTPRKTGFVQPCRDSNAGEPELVSLAVDAASSGNPGKMEYRGVWTATGEEVFRSGLFEEATNNVGEFLALVHGLAFLKKKGLTMPVYSDSVTAMCWVRVKKCRSTVKHTAHNAAMFKQIARAEAWLAENTYTTTILKWDTRNWGEIPADFGRK